MRVTLSVIKADIGSIGGHIRPSAELFNRVREQVISAGSGLLIDHYLSYTGDDIAILMTHEKGVGDGAVHVLDGRLHALAQPLAGVLVAELDGLVLARGGTRGNCGAADLSGVQGDFDLHGGVSAAVENEAAGDVVDRGHALS